MVSNRSHRQIGILVFFIIVYDLVSKGISVNFVFIPLMLILTVYGSILPDILEPSRNQHHRRFFHSLLILMLVIVFIAKVYIDITSGNIDNVIVMFMFFMCSGYASHLIADFLTYKGLPLTGL